MENHALPGLREFLVKAKLRTYASGVETIFHRDREVYRLDYYGGAIA